MKIMIFILVCLLIGNQRLDAQSLCSENNNLEICLDVGGGSEFRVFLKNMGDDSLLVLSPDYWSVFVSRERSKKISRLLLRICPDSRRLLHTDFSKLPTVNLAPHMKMTVWLDSPLIEPSSVAEIRLWSIVLSVEYLPFRDLVPITDYQTFSNRARHDGVDFINRGWYDNEEEVLGKEKYERNWGKVVKYQIKTWKGNGANGNGSN